MLAHLRVFLDLAAIFLTKLLCLPLHGLLPCDVRSLQTGGRAVQTSRTQDGNRAHRVRCQRVSGGELRHVRLNHRSECTLDAGKGRGCPKRLVDILSHLRLTIPPLLRNGFLLYLLLLHLVLCNFNVLRSRSLEVSSQFCLVGLLEPPLHKAHLWLAQAVPWATPGSSLGHGVVRPAQ